ncbi:major facilitator superfamily domain-containing protein [Aspergillus avenaceus]|uniref:Major facilitator superfamily domain-containing protein n=1 Tax=Aspergillus avenaceus TaxID=36643 RepID=A0A5N6TEK6_ASPAV|nr:major facilitator superfamily domain-containing protein [Aspergillus avenaceus]
MGQPDLESQTPKTIDEVAKEKEEKPSAEKGYGLPTWRKCIILFVVSWMTLAVTFSSTSLLPATPEIAEEFNTTTEILNITNAGVLLAMGFSSLIWGPLNNLIGRRLSYNSAILMLCACSAASAAAVDMKMFTAFRVLSGLTGTSFMVSGQTILADIFEPVVRGTAVGFFMAGTVAGPAIGPCIGGLIVTFSNWRNIYWLQVGMTGFGLALAVIFVPEIKSADKGEVEIEKPDQNKLWSSLRLFNPLRIFRQWVYPNIFLSVRQLLRRKTILTQ